MNKTIQKVLIFFWIIAIGMLTKVIIDFYQESRIVTAKEYEKQQIVVMTSCEEESNYKYLQTLLAEYSKIEGNPEVVLQYVTQAEFQKELCIRNDQNKLPDLIIYENVMTPAIQSMGILKDLSEYMTPQKTSEYLKNAYNSTVVNGIPYAVPFTSNPYVIFYNKDYFSKFHMEMPEQMQDFYNFCKESKTLGTYNFGMAAENKEDVTSCMLQMIYSAGGTLRNLDTQNCLLLYKMLGEFRDEGIIAQDIVNWNQNDLMEAFSKGLVKVAIAELSATSLLEEQNIKFEYGITEIPYIQKQSYLMQGENIGISSTADYYESLELLKYITSAEAVKNYCETAHTLSVRMDITVNPAKDHGLSQAFVERVRNQNILKSSYTSWFIISDAISENVTDFFGDKTVTAEELAEKLQEDVRNAIMER